MNHISEETEKKKYVALTFDDGPNTTTTQRVLDRLEKYSAKATFFLIGNNITAKTEPVIKRAVGLCCEIGNHSLTHSYMDKMSAEEIRAEVSSVNEKIRLITGSEPCFFRPPFIAVSPLMTDVIDMPFVSGFGCNDWDDSAGKSERYEMLMSQVRDGAILLLHDSEGNSTTVELLDLLIPELIKRGYELVTLTELFRLKGNESAPMKKIIYTHARQTGMWD